MSSHDPATDAMPADARTIVTLAIDGPRDARFYEPDKLMVKFHDRFRVRLRDEKLVTVGPGPELSDEIQALLRPSRDQTLLRMHDVDEERLDTWVEAARKALGSPVADLNNYYLVLLDAPRAFELSAELLRTAEVELACPLLRPPPAPARDLTGPTSGLSQGYLRSAALNGIDADFAWTVPGGDGRGVSVCDIEYNWNFRHVEFTDNGGLVLLGNPPSYSADDLSHGTCVVGIIGSNRDFAVVSTSDGGTLQVADGTTGIAFGCRKFACAALTFFIYNVAGAITKAMEGISRGDVVLIEQQEPGPNAAFVSGGQLRDKESQQGLVPSEWTRATYDAIRVAVGNGVIVVEAAGNGGEDLDARAYHPAPNVVQRLLGITPHRPFVPGNSSGAILVGAGTSSGRARLSWSNFGSRLDVQAWGDNVVTTESRGTTSNPDIDNVGPDDQYTSSFGGTSSASAIVAGACASLQGVHRRLFDRPASPGRLRELLLTTRSFQSGNASQHIGPLPNLRMAIEAMMGALPPAPWLPASGAHPLPLTVTMGVWAPRFRDVQLWYTVDGLPPREGASMRYEEPLQLDEPGEVEIRARTFATNEEGLRVASPMIATAEYQLYRRPPGPRNFTASRGAFADHIAMTWQSVDRASGSSVVSRSSSTYDVFVVYGPEQAPRAAKLNTEPIVGTHFDLYPRGAAPLIPQRFFVQATVHPRVILPGSPTELISEPSETAEGWVGAGAPQLAASKGELVDRVRLRWTAIDFGNIYDLSAEYLVFRAEQPSPSAAALIAHLTRSSRTIFINGRRRDVPVPAATTIDDAAVEPGRTYYYWVKATGQNTDGVAIETPLSDMDSGFARLS